MTWNEDELNIIELKAESPMIGIVTEIFFYSNYLLDFVDLKGLFQLDADTAWTAWIYDMDYPTMLFSGYSCSIHDNYASFKEDFLKDIDERINIARDFMDSRDISEYAQNVRDAKAMIEQMEAFADNPEAFLENE